MILIDTGHGYNTPGKRSDGFHDEKGRVLLKENSFNEAIGNKLSMLFHVNNVPHNFITNEWYDVSLDERVAREHKLATKKSVLISIHADAFDKNKAQGGTFFYYSDKGKKIAEKLTSFMIDNDYDLKMRSAKRGNYKILRETKSTAVLFEAGFMTTKHDLDYLLSDLFRNKTAVLLFEGMKNLP